jgi:hypothetical protein
VRRFLPKSFSAAGSGGCYRMLRHEHPSLLRLEASYKYLNRLSFLPILSRLFPEIFPGAKLAFPLTPRAFCVRKLAPPSRRAR